MEKFGKEDYKVKEERLSVTFDMKSRLKCSGKQSSGSLYHKVDVLGKKQSGISLLLLEHRANEGDSIPWN